MNTVDYYQFLDSIFSALLSLSSKTFHIPRTVVMENKNIYIVLTTVFGNKIINTHINLFPRY